MERTRKRIDEWKRKLVDLSRRNRLLHFRPARGSTLRVIEPTPSEVFRRLVIQEKSWKVHLPPEAAEEGTEFPNPQLPLAQDIATSAPLRLTPPLQTPTEIVCTPQPGQAIRTVLRNIYRRSRSDFDERGVRILHFAFGFFDWKETPQSEAVRSPLLLLPVQISRASAREPYVVSASEEEIVLNPALDVKLANDFNIQVPRLPDELDDFNLAAYVAELESRVRSLGWSTSLECWLGLFSFHKLVMYKDLEAHGDLVRGHPIVRALCEDAEVGDPNDGRIPEPRRLDELLEPKDSYLVLDADSSQLACIEAVKRGANLILQGPPGTGKSQTIANIVAESIAAGRSVLFMSEKMAALEVVHKRLVEANLGQYCLELHSQKANKKKVIDELYRCFKTSEQPKQGMTELEFQKIANRRGQLNGYVTALHQVRQPLMQSAHNGLGELAVLEPYPLLSSGSFPAESLTPGLLDCADQLAHRLSRVWHITREGSHFPWYGCIIDLFTIDMRTTLLTLISRTQAKLRVIAADSKQIAANVECPTPTTVDDVNWLIRLGDLLGQSPRIEEHWLLSPHLPSVERTAQGLKEKSSTYWEIKQYLVPRYNEAYFHVSKTLHDELDRALGATSSFLAVHAVNEPKIISHRVVIQRYLDSLIRHLEVWKHDGNEISRYLELPEPQTLHGLRHLLRIEELCRTSERPEARWFAPGFLEDVQRSVPLIRSDHEARTRVRSELLSRYEESLFSLMPGAPRFLECVQGALSSLGFSTEAEGPLLANIKAVAEWATELAALAQEWTKSATAICQSLGLPLDLRIEDCPRLIRLSDLCDAHDRPAREWFHPELFKEVRQSLPMIRRDHETRESARSKILEEYEESFLRKDLDRLIEMVSTHYSSFTRWIKPGFYRLRRDLCQCRRDGQIPKRLLKDLLAARDVLRLEKKIAQQSDRFQRLLGGWYRKYETDFNRLEEAVAVCVELIGLVGGLGNDRVRDQASLGSTPSPEPRMAARQLRATVVVWEQKTDCLFTQLPIAPVLPSRMTLRTCQMSELAEWATGLAGQAQIVLDFYADVKASIRVGLDLTPQEILSDLRLLSNLMDLEKKIGAGAERAQTLLGRWYGQYDTDFSRIELAVTVAKEVCAATEGHPTPSLIRTIALGTQPPTSLVKIAAHLRDGLASWEDATSELPEILPLRRIPSTGLPIEQSLLDDVMSWAKGSLGQLASLSRLIDSIQVTLRSEEIRTPATLLSDLSRLGHLRQLEEEVNSKHSELAQVFGWRFQGIETNWDDVLEALAWAARLRAVFGEDPPPAGVIALACHGSRNAVDVASLRLEADAFERSYKELASYFDATERFRGPIEFRRTEELLGSMSDRIDELRDWVDFRKLTIELQRSGLGGLYAQLAQHSHVPSDQVPPIIRRALLQGWIDWVFANDHALGKFRTEDHEELIREFRDLDRKHRQLGAHRVIAQADKIRKERFVTSQVQPPMPGFLKTAEDMRRDRVGSKGVQNGLDAEIRVLTYEAHKKKRHLPVRMLLSRIPRLLTALKPCLLMSPLSVSQFLDPEKICFDLIVFDEASQILPEDAIGAIYRGRQMVACGDKHQLPPTTFFEQGLSDDFETENVEESFDVFESILEECAAKAQLPALSLRWHYRSRHESLIAFSNHRFYRDELVTFPAAEHDDPRLGIHFKYVPDGVYDRGGRRDNQQEAEVVVDQVVHHLLEQPRRSLGVVAFSVAQMNAIEDRIEVLLRKKPELEKFFGADRLEGFFVKNLENVQGDERDIMIFSIGYGKDRHGELKMNFGPLNISGGERRLNVAVTRAREKVVIVSSIRAADFDLTRVQAPGVLALYHYLDYAERGPVALQLNFGRRPGDYESPLEQDVAGAIRTLGYEVMPQVGCSGYRIDLGVIDPGKPGRFILGVECDGASYHSAHTARDRDRLRQQVLQDLGWRIHRIWSPDWVTRRTTEIRRLQEAIEAARSSIQEHVAPKTPPDGTEGQAKHNTPNLSSSALGDARNPHETNIAYESKEVVKRLDAPGASPRIPVTGTASASKSPRVENPPNKGPAVGTQPPATSGPFARPLLNSPVLWDLLFDWAMREKRLGPSQERLAGWLRMALRQKTKITEKQRQYADEIFDKATRLGFKSTGHSR